GFIGGERLEADLKRARRRKKLFGILNGCDYAGLERQQVTKEELVSLINACLLSWVGDRTRISAAWFFAQRRLQEWAGKKNPDDFVLASVGRLTAQKVSLLEVDVAAGHSALEVMLDVLGEGLYIMVGSGDAEHEEFMTRAMMRHANFLFLQGYSDALAEKLYHFCDLFLMPSSYEPCGISQMLAMRAGKPCLVHRVGGLSDTVKNNKNGFTFVGKSPQEQAQAMLMSLRKILLMRSRQPQKWQKIAQAAADSRFSWDISVAQYLEKLYPDAVPEQAVAPPYSKS
ncbi:MAG: glycosyltransferase, partial [Pseudomonadales bacterium]|nr:glycosyltransferase [Pseudomonadales bacterium]